MIEIRGRSLIITRGVTNKWYGIGPDSMTPPIGGGADSMTPPIREGLDSMTPPIRGGLDSMTPPLARPASLSDLK